MSQARWHAAASARLCVETPHTLYHKRGSGTQPPPRGCVLKHCLTYGTLPNRQQPPPRGCVLKPKTFATLASIDKAAASARLCVETFFERFRFLDNAAAASARLCVETICQHLISKQQEAAASARLCVETPDVYFLATLKTAAASARLCVETHNVVCNITNNVRSRLRAAVC